MMQTPQLRFPEFTDEWQVKKLGDIASFIKDGTHGTHPDDPKGEYYLLSAKNLQYGTIEIDDSDRKISKIEYDSITKKYALKTSDILLSIVGTIGRVSQIPEKYLGNTAYQRSVAFLRFGGENSTFIAQLFNGRKFQNELRRRQVVSAQPGIYLGDIAKIQINLPSKPEQKKIADFLTAVDERIAVGEKKLELLETYKRGVMQKIFSQQVRFKDDNGNPYPDWEERKVSDFLHERKSYAQKDGSYEHISLTTAGVVPKSERYERDFLVGSEDKKYRITKIDDICYNPANLKFGVIARNKYKVGIFSPIYVTYEVRDADVSFVEYLVVRNDFIQYARKFEEGTVYERMAVNPRDLATLVVKMPIIEEQKKIANFLTTLDEKITAEKSKLTTTRQFKKALLQRMFV